MFKNMFLNWSLKKRRQELELFVESLKGMDDSDVLMVLFAATMIRIDMKNQASNLDFLYPLDVLQRSPWYCAIVNKEIRRRQKLREMPQATGWMVWLHTFRVCEEPPLRLLGRQMWGELERGMKIVKVMKNNPQPEFSMFTDDDGLNETLLEDMCQFPEGLEPIKSE